MPKRDYDPLALIPSADTLRKKLAEVQERARRLRVLLRTAEEIERQQAKSTDTTQQGVAHE